MRPPRRLTTMVRMIILSALAPATAVALWHEPGALWAWAMLAALIGFTTGTMRWLRWQRHQAETEAETRTAARRRRLARLTGRPDVFGVERDRRDL